MSGGTLLRSDTWSDGRQDGGGCPERTVEDGEARLDVCGGGCTHAQRLEPAVLRPGLHRQIVERRRGGGVDALPVFLCEQQARNGRPSQVREAHQRHRQEGVEELQGAARPRTVLHGRSGDEEDRH